MILSSSEKGRNQKLLWQCQDSQERNRRLNQTIVTMGGDLQPGCLADRLLTGLGQPHIYFQSSKLHKPNRIDASTFQALQRPVPKHQHPNRKSSLQHMIRHSYGHIAAAVACQKSASGKSKGHQKVHIAQACMLHKACRKEQRPGF